MHPWVLYLDLNRIPVGAMLNTVSLPAPPSVLVNGSFRSFFCFWGGGDCFTLSYTASLFGRHHSAAQRGGSSWSGLQLHQRGGVPRPGGKWTAAGERHLRWYVSTQHRFKKKNRMENIMCCCELLATCSNVYHLGLHVDWMDRIYKALF